MLVKMLTEHGVQPTVVVWDRGSSGRKEVYSEYKGHRPKKPDLLAEQSGVLIAPDDVGALAAALLVLIENPAERARIGARALERVRTTFDVDVVWRRIDAVYREAIAS